MILLFLALVQINLYSNKNTYLLGEDIWIRWEFVNTGNRSGYIEECNEFWILNYGYYEIEIIKGEEYFPIRKYFKMWDEEGKLVPQHEFGSPSVTYDGLKAMTIPKIVKIEAGDTIKSKPVNLIGAFGTLSFKGSLFGFPGYHIKPGYYKLTFSHRTKERGKIKTIWSDTINITIRVPVGKETKAFNLYKNLRIEGRYIKSSNPSVFIYADSIIRKHPTSAYIGSAMNSLSLFLFFKQEVGEVDNEFRQALRKTLNYIIKNIKEFSDDYIILDHTLWVIMRGESILGTSEERIREILLELNVPLDNHTEEHIGEF